VREQAPDLSTVAEQRQSLHTGDLPSALTAAELRRQLPLEPPQHKLRAKSLKGLTIGGDRVLMSEAAASKHQHHHRAVLVSHCRLAGLVSSLGHRKANAKVAPLDISPPGALKEAKESTCRYLW